MDRNGADLAISVPQSTIYADPHQVTYPRSEASALAGLLGAGAHQVENELEANSGFVYLARQVPDATAAAVANLHLAGIFALQEPKRFDPAGQLALPLIGTVDIDSNGLSGLEYRYEPHPTEYSTPGDILTNSSNIGTIQIAQRLGPPTLMNYLQRYGLDQRSDINFPGESKGLIPPLAKWSGTSIATIAFGQGIAVTAMQMLAAYNTIADGGIYLPPRLIKATVGAHGHQHTVPEPAGHRVVSPTVAAQMTAMLQQVVTTGTGTAAAIAPYTVAGKTGTAYVVKPGGGYQIGHYVSSFAGFAPAQNPVITAMVVMDNTTDYAAQAAGPAFATITSDALVQLHVPPPP